MATFEVNDMTCGHCINTITKAVALVDPGAKVQVDLASHRVQIEPTAASADVLSDAMQMAGFSPVAVAGTTAQAVTAAPRKGCCCG
ncbi:MAG: heavy-metal-associated domain-containing protein [Variovorax sp.]